VENFFYAEVENLKPKNYHYQGLAEEGSAEGRRARHKARGAGSLISGGRQNLAHGPGCTCSHHCGHVWEEILPHPSLSSF